MLTEFRIDWVTIWISIHGLTWTRVQELDRGSAHSVLTTDTEIAIAGVLGPALDPTYPTPDM
jgi:hypothetical protein